MKKITTKTFLAVLYGMGLSLTQLQAQTVAPGDLILFFQKPGNNNTAYVNLGKAATLFRGAESGPSAAQQRVDFININATLNTAFGTEWASDPDLFAGLAGVFSNIVDPTVVDGDQYRTLYVSRARNSVGTIGSSGSAQWDLISQGNLTLASTNMLGLTNNFAVRLPGVSQGVVPVVDSVIDDQNPTSIAGVQGTAFGQFAGGVQQRGTASTIGTFGPAGVVEFALDLQRLVPNSDVIEGKVAGPTRLGTFEGTVTVATNGDVSFITQGVTPGGFTTWIDGFNPPLTNPADREADADPDQDGIDNLMEFVLNGNPSVSSQAILPTLDATGANFVFSFTRRADSAGEVAQVFEYSTDLVDWTTKAPIAIPTTPGSSGFVTVGATTGSAPNEVQAVSISIPKGSDTKLFGRLKAIIE